MAMNGYPEDLSTKPLPWTRAEVAAAFDSVGDKVAAKASQQAVDNMASLIAQINAEKMSKTGATATAPLYGVSANTSTGNALATVDDVIRLATALINAQVGGTPPSITQQPAISVVGGGSVAPGGVLQISTAATFANVDGGQPTKVWQANQGSASLENTASGDTYTIGNGDVGKSITIYYTATATGYQTLNARSNAFVVQSAAVTAENRLQLGLADLGLPHESIPTPTPVGQWGLSPTVTQGAYPHGSSIPAWWYSAGGTYFENWPLASSWWSVFWGAGNTATNAAVEISGLEMWAMKTSDKTWVNLHHGDVAGWHARYIANSTIYGPSGLTDDTVDTATTTKTHPEYNVAVHGGGGNLKSLPWVSGDTDDLYALCAFVRFRLVKWDAGGVDDLDNAVIVVNSGIDLYPNPASLLDGGPGSPSCGTGRFLLATRNWRLARLVVKKDLGTASDAVFLSYGQPTWYYEGDSEGGGGGGEGGGGETALDWGGGINANASRYVSMTLPALGSAWTLGFRFRANKVTDVTPDWYEHGLVTANYPYTDPGIYWGVTQYGTTYCYIMETGGTVWWLQEGTVSLPSNGSDWVVVVTRDASNWSYYLYPEGSAVSTHIAQQAISGSGIPSQTLTIGDTTAPGWWMNPLGDFFILSRALSVSEVETFVQGADITTIEASPVVNLPFRSGSTGSNGGGVEDNTGTGGATNDATISGTGWATTTAFT